MSTAFKDPDSHTYLAGTAVASSSLMQEVAGLSPFTVMTIFLSLNSLKHLEKTPVGHIRLH